MAAATNPDFGAVLRHYRSDVGLTQEELAERARLSRRGIAALERGERLRPHPETIRLLADALQLEGGRRSHFEAVARSRAVPATEAAELPLVGRQHEMALLERHLAGEGPPVLLLAGERGIGKSRLLLEAARRVGLRGWTVLRGGCQRRSAQEPYSPIVQALADHIATQSPRQLRQALHGCSWLVRLLPELLEIAQAPLSLGALPPEQEQRLMFGAVLRYLANVAGSVGLLLVLDDLHWAGPDAVDLLSHVAQAAPEIRLHVIGAYRATEVEAQHPLSPLLADLGRTGLVARLALGPLTTTEADELLRILVSDQEQIAPETRDRVLERSDGVPFFLVSYAHGLQAGAFRGETPEAPAWTMAEGIRQRVAVLPEETQNALAAAAVAGRVVSPPLLAAALAHTRDELLLALDVTERAGLLVAEDAQAYRFAHDAIREVIERDLSVSRRTFLHRRIADALEQLPGDVRQSRAAELAWHFLQGDEAERALPYSMLAANQAESVLAHSEAQQHYQTATEIARRMGDRAQEAEALDKLGCCLRLLGRYRGALEALEGAAFLYRSTGDSEGEAQAVAEIGRVHGLCLTPHEGLVRIQELLASRPEDQPSHGLVALRIVQASLLPPIENFAEGLVAAQRAVELAGELGDGRLQARAQYLRSKMLVGVGRSGEALEGLDEVIRLTEATGDLETLYEAVYTAADAHQRQGEVDRGKQYIRRALELAEQMADPRRMGTAAWKLYWLNEWGEARGYLERAVTLSRELGESPDSSAHHLIYLGELRWAQGDREAASRLLREGLARAERSGDVGMTQFAQMVLAHLDVDAGHPEAAAARLEAYRTTFQRTSGVGALAQLADAYLLMGEDARAAEIVDNEPVSVLNRGLGLEMGAVYALRVRGMLRTRQGRWEEARKAFDEAVGLGKKMSYLWFLAWTLRDYGLMCLQMGEEEEGRARMEEALALFQRLGAREHAGKAEQTLADIPA